MLNRAPRESHCYTFLRLLPPPLNPSLLPRQTAFIFWRSVEYTHGTYTHAYIRDPLRVHVHGIARRSIIRRPALAVASRRDGRMNGECSLNIRTSPLNPPRMKIILLSGKPMETRAHASLIHVEGDIFRIAQRSEIDLP